MTHANLVSKCELFNDITGEICIVDETMEFESIEQPASFFLQLPFSISAGLLTVGCRDLPFFRVINCRRLKMQRKPGRPQKQAAYFTHIEQSPTRPAELYYSLAELIDSRIKRADVRLN